MKTDPTGNQDEALHRVLQEWRVDASPPPGLQEHVWRRIEYARAQAAPSAWASIINCFQDQVWLRVTRARASDLPAARTAITNWIEWALRRPAIPASYAAMLLVIGGTAGWEQAHHANVRVREELGQRYIRAVDPYLAPRE